MEQFLTKRGVCATPIILIAARCNGSFRGLSEDLERLADSRAACLYRNTAALSIEQQLLCAQRTGTCTLSTALMVNRCENRAHGVGRKRTKPHLREPCTAGIGATMSRSYTYKPVEMHILLGHSQISIRQRCTVLDLGHPDRRTTQHGVDQ